MKLNNQIENLIISSFGSFAVPKKIFYVKQIPKTRSGKILRRLLRNILINPNLKNYGDTSTILNLNSLKNKTSSEWRDYATQCMVEILSQK